MIDIAAGDTRGQLTDRYSTHLEHPLELPAHPQQGQQAGQQGEGGHAVPLWVWGVGSLH